METQACDKLCKKSELATSSTQTTYFLELYTFEMISLYARI